MLGIPTILDEVRADGMKLPPHMHKPLGGAVAAARSFGKAERRKVVPPKVVVGKSCDFRRSIARPNVIFAGVSDQMLMRNGVCVEASWRVRRILLSLFAAQGRLLSRADLIDALYGDDPDGGPVSANQALSVYLTAARDAGAVLGFQLESQYGGGIRLVETRP